jgi:hypothetical protein
MWWLWIVGPLAVGLVYIVTGASTNPRYLRALEGWRSDMGARRAKERKQTRATKKGASQGADPAPVKKKKEKAVDLRPKQVAQLPSAFRPIAHLAGGGNEIGRYELIKDLAYLLAVEADPRGTSDHQTVLLRLEEPAPRMTVRPLPGADGELTSQEGIQFRKDPVFPTHFVVDGAPNDAKAIGRWLSKPLREMLCDAPSVWLRVDGKLLALTIYGRIEEEALDKLIDLADVFSAEHGAEGGPSFFGGDGSERAARLAAIGDDEDDEEEDRDEEEDDDSDDDEEAAEAPPSEAARAKGPRSKA